MATAARVAPAPPEVEIQAQTQVQETAKSPIEAYHWLRCQTTVEISVAEFTVGQLLNVRPGSVAQAATSVANDVPIRINKTLLGWGRFEVLGDQLAVRITELA